jgi:hypothetical protein
MITTLWVKTMDGVVFVYVINRSGLTFDPNRTRRRIGIHIALQRNGDAFPQRESKPRNTTDGERRAICKTDSKTVCQSVSNDVSYS